MEQELELLLGHIVPLPPMPLLPLTAEAQADDHVADQSDANETDQSDRQLLHPGQDICTPAIAKSLLSYVVNR